MLDLVQAALDDGTFVKLTLSAPRGSDKSLRNVQIRAIDIKGAPHLSFVYHHVTRDITKNFIAAEAMALLAEILGTDFRNAHLFTTRGSAQLEIRDGHGARLREGPARHETSPPTQHDRSRQRQIPAGSAWLHELGVTTGEGKVARGMEAKFRQIDKFVELFASLLAESGLADQGRISVTDMGCGKGYLTFAIFDWLRRQDAARDLQVLGVEARPELVELDNRIARQYAFAGLTFSAGNIATANLAAVDILIALHACDTATDDAIARGIEAGARLIIVSPCCHKEVRPQLAPPPALKEALRHGILQERQAELITDSLRAALLEWAGYDTKVFEFISTEHTAKNLMIAAVRRRDGNDRDERRAVRARELAAHFGIRFQTLAAKLGFELAPAS